jgi:SEC-C motif
MADRSRNGSATPVLRRSPCPCGSGKRYKNCHGRTVGPISINGSPNNRLPALPQHGVERIESRRETTVSHRERWPLITLNRFMTEPPPHDEEILHRPLYKFMRPEHAAALLSDGCVRVGTMYGYRDQESHGFVVGDEGEGCAARYDDRPLMRRDTPAGANRTADRGSPRTDKACPNSCDGARVVDDTVAAPALPLAGAP